MIAEEPVIHWELYITQPAGKTNLIFIDIFSFIKCYLQLISKLLLLGRVPYFLCLTRCVFLLWIHIFRKGSTFLMPGHFFFSIVYQNVGIHGAYLIFEEKTYVEII